MAETSTLTSAHNHARKAAEEFEQVHLSDAATQHRLASVDFARAAKGTSDSEALRVLKLLEQQHQRLAQIVKSHDDPSQPSSTSEETKSPEQPVADKASVTISPPSGKVAVTKPKASTAALASTRIGSKARDSSPSLARDIASRRGIPQPGKSQPSTAAQARAGQLSPESRRKPPRGPIVPPSIVDSQADLRQGREAKKTEEDEGFTKFYNSLTTGTMSKLSSVLAYAGLPLAPEDAVKNDQPSKQKPEWRTVSASNDPDVKKIFSKAALDAIEDEHRQRGTLGHGFGPAESFYVVQKGGGTYSYADIARAQQQRWGEEDSEPEFVDAKEVHGPASPKHNRLSHKKRGSFGKPRTEEELELENTTLKSTLEQMTSRLQAFEAHAQDASMAALTQSMVSIRPSPNPAVANTDDAGVQERLQQLEDQLERKAENEQKLQTLNEKQTRELKKYKYHFEELKKGARRKQDQKETGGDGVTGD